MRSHIKQLIYLTILIALATPSVSHAISLSEIIFQISGLFLGMAAGIMDMAISQFVLQMGALVRSGTDFGNGIEGVWTIVRDLVNLTFIFGLIYVGILTIIGKAGGKTKGLIVSIIIGALLVNFSLFISRAIIDVANLFTVEIYQTMGLQNPQNIAGVSRGVSMSEVIMAQAGLWDLTLNGYDPAQAPDLDSDEYIPFVVGGSIFLIVTTFVFATAGILLIIRFALLVILMALSPIAFIPNEIPIIGGWRKQWWDTFINQALFAPALFFMLYVTLLIGNNFGDRTQTLGGIFKQGSFQDGYTAAVFFLLLIIGMIASIVIAKQMSAHGAKKIHGWGTKARKYGQRMVGRTTFGTAGFVGRNTIGRGASKLASTDSMRRWAANSVLGEYALRGTRSVAGASFDARNVGGAGKKLGLGAPKGKGGYEAKLKKQIEEREKFGKSLGTDDTKVAEAKEAAAKGINTKIQDLQGQLAQARKNAGNMAASQGYREREQAEAARLEREIRDAEASKTKTVKAAEATAKKALQEGYAGRIEKQRSLNTLYLKSSRANKEAAKKLRKEKSQEDKLLDAVKEAAKSGGDDKKEGGKEE